MAVLSTCANSPRPMPTGLLKICSSVTATSGGTRLSWISCGMNAVMPLKPPKYMVPSDARRAAPSKYEPSTVPSALS
ncbi:hypothetical protein D3C87_930020 [compost metagenome]